MIQPTTRPLLCPGRSVGPLTRLDPLVQDVPRYGTSCPSVRSGGAPSSTESRRRRATRVALDFRFADRQRSFRLHTLFGAAPCPAGRPGPHLHQVWGGCRVLGVANTCQRFPHINTHVWVRVRKLWAAPSSRNSFGPSLE